MDYTIENFKQMISKQTDKELYETYKANLMQSNAIENIKLIGIPVEGGDAYWELEKVVRERRHAIAKERDGR